MDAPGNVYGTTDYGGPAAVGTVFKLAPNGDGTYTESVLYSFRDGQDSGHPYGGVILDRRAISTAPPRATTAAFGRSAARRPARRDVDRNDCLSLPGWLRWRHPVWRIGDGRLRQSLRHSTLWRAVRRGVDLR